MQRNEMQPTSRSRIVRCSTGACYPMLQAKLVGWMMLMLTVLRTAKSLPLGDFRPLSVRGAPNQEQSVLGDVTVLLATPEAKAEATLEISLVVKCLEEWVTNAMRSELASAGFGPPRSAYLDGVTADKILVSFSNTPPKRRYVIELVMVAHFSTKIAHQSKMPVDLLLFGILESMFGTSQHHLNHLCRSKGRLLLEAEIEEVRAVTPAQIAITSMPNPLSTSSPLGPVAVPTAIPTGFPTPLVNETGIPTGGPTVEMTWPSSAPSTFPKPTPSPTAPPTFSPTISHAPTEYPSRIPSASPTASPRPTESMLPSASPSQYPSLTPTISPRPSTEPSNYPSDQPSTTPTLEPSFQPSISFQPSTVPSYRPSPEPTISLQPSGSPSTSHAPTITAMPSTSEPTITPRPTDTPSAHPSEGPSHQPSSSPSLAPSSQPTIVLDVWAEHGIMQMTLRNMNMTIEGPQRQQWNRITSAFVKEFWNDPIITPFSPAYLGNVTTSFRSQTRVMNESNPTTIQNLRIRYSQIIQYGIHQDVEEHPYGNLNETLFLMPFQTRGVEYTNELQKIWNISEPIFIVSVRIGEDALPSKPSNRLNGLAIVLIVVVFVTLCLVAAAAYMYYLLQKEAEEDAVHILAAPENDTVDSREYDQSHVVLSTGDNRQEESTANKGPSPSIPVIQPLAAGDGIYRTGRKRRPSNDNGSQGGSYNGDHTSLEGMVIRSTFPPVVSLSPHRMVSTGTQLTTSDPGEEVISPHIPLLSLDPTATRSEDDDIYVEGSDSDDSNEDDPHRPHFSGFLMQVHDLDD